ncbi:uncharacterized protein FOMMEDRAFT_143112 [Fomitiporia mediterranea MF3/22]|uniref:uncharacterized protein n=1 Tax=Fomitiporia mediterranea (strain MF3/22) TaxID=694068 RepID=UPI000440882E|nr:uncharacterized protein FOMMEDRAFT_143112 [Fomitiporia mediterranea MF3/22]EJC98718.1 hypothetical protein FOMMEDRAFT_143112 [Fomitiporia mediterranea MF3/22]
MAAAAVATAPSALPLPTSVAEQNVPSLSRSYPLPPTPPLSDDERDDGADLKLCLESDAESPCELSQRPLVFERSMGDTEVSYYLPSRADGVNDMYLHLGFRVPTSLLAPARVRAAWAYMRLIHPPLAAHVRMEPWEYTSTRFAYAPPRSVAEALSEADAALEFKSETKDALINAYLNGPRTLSNERLSHLILGNVPAERTPGLPTPVATPAAVDEHAEAFPSVPADEVLEFDLLICAAHFLGDGMALHTFANEFFQLIAGKDENGHERSTEAIEEMLEREWVSLWGSGKETKSSDVLPLSLEDALPQINGRFRNAAAKVDFKNSEAKDIGGHAFPRRKSSIRHTVVPTVALDAKKTKAILKRCKENGVSIANAIFSLSAVAWSRMKAEEDKTKARQNSELPLMMYTALNIRPYLLASATANRSYWFTAIGYLNVVLPSFLPASTSDFEALKRTFWLRARSAKKQISQGAKNPLLVSRTHEMARVRGERARKWAREDDEKDAGIWTPPASARPTPAAPIAETESSKKPWTLPPAPSTALIGLSMLGNLDGMYAHADYPSLVLHTLTTGSRQRNGAALLFGYTFAGKLWLSLGYDEEGFADGAMERWWAEVLRGVDEFLVD